MPEVQCDSRQKRNGLVTHPKVMQFATPVLARGSVTLEISRSLAMLCTSVLFVVRKSADMFGQGFKNLEGLTDRRISLARRFAPVCLILAWPPLQRTLLDQGYAVTYVAHLCGTRDVCWRTFRASILDISTAWSRALKRPACAKNRRNVCRPCPSPL